MKIALFDFDGTITYKDSLAEFIKYAVGKPKYFLGLFLQSPIIVAYFLKLISNHRAKQILFSYFFKNWDKNIFQKIAAAYSETKIDGITRKESIERIIWHQQNGHKVIVVSASMESWLKKWCERNNLDLLATKHEIKDSKLTGRFATPNCYGAEKIKRIKELYDLQSYDYIYAYGDSRGDREMMSIADEKHHIGRSK